MNKYACLSLVSGMFALSLLVTVLGCAVPVGYVASGFIPEDELKIVRFMNKGVSEFSRSRFIDAEALFTEALVLAPESRIVNHNLALTHSRMGAYSEAEQSLRELLMTTTDEIERVNLYFELGNLFASQLQFEKSLAFLEMALERHEQVTTPIEVDSGESLEPGQATPLEVPVKAIEAVERKLVERVVILEALLEVAVRSGEYSKARCFADDTVAQKLALTPVDYKSLLRTIKVFNLIGFSGEARSHILHWMPKVLIQRNAAIAHTLALTYLESGDFDEFVQWESSASVAFDSDETTKTEIDYVSSLLLGFVGQESGHGETVQETIEEESKYWPSGVRLLQIDVEQQGEQSPLLARYQEVGKALEDAIRAAQTATNGDEPTKDTSEQTVTEPSGAPKQSGEEPL